MSDRYGRMLRLGLPGAALALLLVACGGDGVPGDELAGEAPVAGAPALLDGDLRAIPAVAEDPTGLESECDLVEEEVLCPETQAAAGAGADGVSGSTGDGAAGTGSGGQQAVAPSTGSPGAVSGGQTGAPAAGQDGAGQDASTDALLRATARRYERVGSLQADFVQQIRNPLLGRTVDSRGTLYQRQPDRFLMEFSDPDGDVIVSDGQFFWIYYPSVDARQVIRMSGGGPQGLDLHAQFIGDPVSRFDATSHGRESVQGRQAHVVTLVPRQPMGYRSLKVWIDVDDHLVRRFELTEENGSVRVLEFRNMVVNPSLPDRLFSFTPPEGAQVIRR